MDPYTRICFDAPPFNHEGLHTETSDEHIETEEAVMEAYNRWLNIHGNVDEKSAIWREDHVFWLVRSLSRISGGSSLYASQSWLCFWIVHSLDLLNATSFIPAETATAAVDYLLSMQHPQGGFGGGPGQESHVLATYAAIMALLTLGARCSLLTRVMAGIDTTTLAAFYNSVRVTEGENQGALRAHDDGEVDTRTVYCAVAVCAALKMPLQPLFEGTGAWLARCQTYEGGVGAEPHNEAHGGYSYCGLAAALLLGEAHRLDLDALLQWMALRQLGKEGGFNGRANKLVDSCYSLWVGGMFPLLHAAKRAVAMRHAGNVQQQQQQQQQQQGPASRTALDVGVGLSPHPHLQDRHAALMACVLPPPRLGWLFDQRALQQYVTLTCQGAVATSGIRDKPGKFPDFYHTCYALSGLSVAQMSCAPKFSKEELEKEREADGSDDADSDVISVFNMDQYRELNPHILGGASNRLLITNPAYNLTTGVVDAVNSYFAEKDAFASSDESE